MEHMHLMVAPAVKVRRDFWGNRSWMFFLLVSALAWVILSSLLIRCLEGGWGFWHACYFTVINVTTVGFGDVVPHTHFGKVLAGVNGFVGVLLLGTIVAVVTIALQPAGWSASLSSSDAAGAPAEPRTPADVATSKAAAALEGLAALLRTANQDGQPNAESVRVEVRGDSPHLVVIEILVHAG